MPKVKSAYSPLPDVRLKIHTRFFEKPIKGLLKKGKKFLLQRQLKRNEKFTLTPENNPSMPSALVPPPANDFLKRLNSSTTEEEASSSSASELTRGRTIHGGTSAETNDFSEIPSPFTAQDAPSSAPKLGKSQAIRGDADALKRIFSASSHEKDVSTNHSVYESVKLKFAQMKEKKLSLSVFSLLSPLKIPAPFGLPTF